MISIGNKLGPFGRNRFEIAADGWHQKQLYAAKLMLNVTILQKNCMGLLPSTLANLDGHIDTGAPRSVMSRVLFDKMRLKRPSKECSSLEICGVTKQSNLVGWGPIEIHAEPYVYNEKMAFPRAKLGIFVAHNVHDDTFILGLDFLRSYPTLIVDGTLVLFSGLNSTVNIEASAV